MALDGFNQNQPLIYASNSHLIEMEQTKPQGGIKISLMQSRLDQYLFADNIEVLEDVDDG